MDKWPQLNIGRLLTASSAVGDRTEEQISRVVGRAPRKRGGKAKKPGLSTDEHDAILIVRDRHGETTDAMLADLSAETIGVHLKPVVAKDAVLVTDGNRAYEAFAAETGITQMALVASQGARTVGCYHIQNVNAYQSHFKS